jgi:molecular chaperone DnaK
MSRNKIDYGIDLGTTNSAIARMENGEPIIRKSEGFQKDTTPSCIQFNKKKVTIVGDRAYNTLGKEALLCFQKNDPTLLNTFIEFKRTMGTDESYSSKNMDRSYSSEELSAEVLKTLKNYVRDEDVNSIIITVPAKFQGYQDDATMEAAKLAGFQHCELLQEPIAASMAYGLDVQNIDGEWLVFDFGGGTFDVALMSANEGIMKVVDTEGNNHLGGKNLDQAIVDKIIIPYIEENYSIDEILSDEGKNSLLRNALKGFAEEAKINLSPKDKLKYEIYTDEPIGKDSEGTEIELDLTITKESYEGVVKPIFQRAIDLSIKLLENNKLKGSDLNSVLLIGGPTFSETLRNMISEQISKNVDTSIDPMIAVAKGAALYASTKDVPKEVKDVDKSKIQLKLKYQADTVETEEKIGILVLREESEGEIPEKLFVTLERIDKGWASGKVELQGDAEIVDVLLETGKSNGFNITIFDDSGTIHPCEPDSISIIQGFKIASATLPFDLLIDAFELRAGKQQLVSIKGLKKNQSLPAKGSNTFQTQKIIRPGKKEDQIRIPIYSGDKGTKAIYNDLRGEIIITGDHLPGLLPKGEDVELTINVDESRMVSVSACFPYLDDEIIDNVIKKSKRKAASKEYLEREINKATELLQNLEDEFSDLDIADVSEIRVGLNELENLLQSGGSESDTRNEILNRLRIFLKDIDNMESIGEWPKVLEALNKEIERFENTCDQFGDENTSKMLTQFKNQVKTVIQNQDIKSAKKLVEQINMTGFAIVDKGAGVALDISFIKGFDDNFDMHEWSDRNKARTLINDAKSTINANRATKDNLRPLILQLYKLLPDPKDGIGGKPDEDVLIKD